MMMQFSKKQSGAALIVALIMLLVLTILGVAVMETSVLEERMAGNNMRTARTFQAAEGAIREAERRLSLLPQAPIAGEGFVRALGEPNVAVNEWWLDRTDAWWRDTGTNSTQEANQVYPGVTPQPHYFVEEYSSVCDTLVDPQESECVFVFRITAIAWSGRNTTALIQSLYSRRF